MIKKKVKKRKKKGNKKKSNKGANPPNKQGKKRRKKKKKIMISLILPEIMTFQILIHNTRKIMKLLIKISLFFQKLVEKLMKTT